MRKIAALYICLLIVLQLLLAPSYSYAQARPTAQDVVTMLNGEQKSGKVTAITDKTIKFVYSGETLEYEFQKTDINKIVFASGRTEMFTASTPAGSVQQPQSTPEQRRNKIAVLPFDIQTNDPSLATESMSKQVQASCIDALRGLSATQTIQDQMATNNILTKNNLTVADLTKYTPQEWAELLGVQYVVMGAYSIQNKGTSSSGSGVTTHSDKKDDDKKKGTEVTSNNSYSYTNYDTRVRMTVYDDSGASLFSDSKAPAFGGVDSYRSALKSLAKKLPFGKH